MKKYLLPENGNFYKANLHCHTNLSDGKRTPEEIKAEYVEHGYSIVAYTDHDIMIPHHDLTDETFLALTGYEMEINEPKNAPFDFIKSCHMCFIAIDKNEEKQALWHRVHYQYGNAVNNRDKVKFDESIPDFERHYTGECITEMMQTGREKGFFVTYNHPKWSLENYNEYMNYHGMNAMEIYNHGSASLGYDENNGEVYDDMLRGGERIYCIAADDNHNGGDKNSRRYDAFGGFVMIKADKLEYNTITDALVKGNFYASQGPEIHELWFEDGKINITCSSADRIIATFGMRRAGLVCDETGNGVCKASFNVVPDSGYVRLTVIDKSGKYAATNAYFCDELYK